MKKAILLVLIFSVVAGTAFSLAYPRLYKNASAEVFINESAREVNFQMENDTQVYQDHELALLSCNESFTCYSDHYKALVEKNDVATAFADLKSRYSQDSYVKTKCHAIAHAIGNKAMEQYSSISEAYTYGDNFCWSGYYHGVLEGIIKKIETADIKPYLNEFCKDIPSKKSYGFDYYNCVHGIGHGLMAFTNDELPEALQLCDTLKGSWEKTACHSGVFMENVIIDSKNHFTKYLKPSDPLYPCNAVDEKYKNICYLMQTSYMFKISGYDFSKVFDLCSRVEKGYENVCYQSLGRDASTYARQTSENTLLNIATTKQFCDLGKDYQQESNCIIGAVKDFISFYHSKNEADQLCHYIDATFKKICLKTAKTYYSSL